MSPTGTQLPDDFYQTVATPPSREVKTEDQVSAMWSACKVHIASAPTFVAVEHDPYTEYQRL